jgi:hypothetical protein
MGITRTPSHSKLVEKFADSAEQATLGRRGPGPISMARGHANVTFETLLGSRQGMLAAFDESSPRMNSVSRYAAHPSPGDPPGKGQAGDPESSSTGDASPRRLDEILRALPDGELKSLIGRMGVRIDPGKRIDTPSQVARALVGIPDVRDPSRLSPSSRELLHRVAEAGGSLIVPAVPAGLEPLHARGVVYGRRMDEGIELVLPTAFLVQLKSWESEDPRALRALLAQAPFETMSAIATHYLGRPATPPIALSLELAWETLSDRTRLAEEIEKLAPVERRLLEAIDGVGGEVDTQELLDLEREPMRLRGAGGVTPTRRGAGFALERRGFLIPIHPNRHVIPTEVALVVGADRRRLRETRREEIRTFVLEEDHAPRRARFASDPSFLALALAFAVREPGSDVRAGLGTPRSMLVRLAQRFGRDAEAVGLVAALSRAIGLWDATAGSPATPPGSLPLRELTQLLFSTWRRGGAWDEARPEREVLRVAAENRDASPIGALREMVLDALQDLGEGRWIPWRALEGYLSADSRIAGVERLLRRWAERAGVDLPEVLEITRRIALETLPALGIIDLGGGTEDVTGPDTTVRLTPRGRVLVGSGRPTPDPGASKFVDANILRIGTGATVAAVLAMSPFAEIGRVNAELDLIVGPPAIARARAMGIEGDALRARIEALAIPPDALSRVLTQASVVVGRASLVVSSGFLWIDDPEIRELLRTRRSTLELFRDPSPPGGLLIAPEVEFERLVRRCRSLGVEIDGEGIALRVRSASSATIPAVNPGKTPSSPPGPRSDPPPPPPARPARSKTPSPRAR